MNWVKELITKYLRHLYYQYYNTELIRVGRGVAAICLICGNTTLVQKGFLVEYVENVLLLGDRILSKEKRHAEKTRGTDSHGTLRKPKPLHNLPKIVIWANAASDQRKLDVLVRKYSS